jgi:hypothetical protein
MGTGAETERGITATAMAMAVGTAATARKVARATTRNEPATVWFIFALQACALTAPLAD